MIKFSRVVTKWGIGQIVNVLSDKHCLVKLDDVSELSFFKQNLHNELGGLLMNSDEIIGKARG
jgi:hypothetical protein